VKVTPGTNGRKFPGDELQVVASLTEVPAMQLTIGERNAAVHCGRLETVDALL